MNDILELLKNHIDIRLSQLKTFHDAALSLVKCATIGIASIGRNIDGTAKEKHRIKRVDRLIGNSRIDRKAIGTGLVNLFCKNRKRIYVCVDWTDAEDGAHTIIEASIPTRSRGIIFWTRAHRKDWTGEGGMNHAEDEFLEELRQIIPQNITVVILADRGFGRVSFFRKLEELGFEYIARVTMLKWSMDMVAALKSKRQTVISKTSVMDSVFAEQNSAPHHDWSECCLWYPLRMPLWSWQVTMESDEVFIGASWQTPQKRGHLPCGGLDNMSFST